MSHCGWSSVTEAMILGVLTSTKYGRDVRYKDASLRHQRCALHASLSLKRIISLVGAA